MDRAVHLAPGIEGEKLLRMRLVVKRIGQSSPAGNDHQVCGTDDRAG